MTTTEDNNNIITEIQNATQQFKNPQLLTNIQKELDKDHYGDNNEKLFTFIAMITSRLPPRHRMSVGLIGDSSEGKTNVIQTCLQHLPRNWYLQLDRITGACAEDDITQYNLLIWKELNEKGMMQNALDHTKALCEGGLDVLKKVKNEKGEYQPQKIHQDQKAGVHSSTETTYNEEFANRHCPVSIVGTTTKYKEVNRRNKENAKNTTTQIQNIKRRKQETWIQKGLEQLKNYDIIEIPQADIIQERRETARSMRDLQRFLNIIRAITWLHQLQRQNHTQQGYTILTSTRTDIQHAYNISNKIFSQAYTELDNRSRETLEAIKKLITEEGEFSQDIGKDLGNQTFINRTRLQKKLGLQSVNAIKKRLGKLIDLGIIIQLQTNNNTRTLISLNNENTQTYHRPINNLSQTYQYSFIDLKPEKKD